MEANFCKISFMYKCKERKFFQANLAYFHILDISEEQFCKEAKYGFKINNGKRVVYYRKTNEQCEALFIFLSSF